MHFHNVCQTAAGSANNWRGIEHDKVLLFLAAHKICACFRPLAKPSCLLAHQLNISWANVVLAQVVLNEI